MCAYIIYRSMTFEKEKQNRYIKEIGHGGEKLASRYPSYLIWTTCTTDHCRPSQLPL